MSVPWTILYGGTEQAIGAWGLCADFEMEFVNKGVDRVTMRSTELLDAGAAQFTWGNAVTIYRDRTLTGSTYSGGTCMFQGYVSEVRRETTGGRQNICYVFSGPWWLFERLVFMQGRMVFSGYSTPGNPLSAPVLVQVNTPEVFLGETINELYQTNGQQITEILNWVNECYNPTKRGATSGRNNAQDVITIGTIDPAVNMPKSRANSIFCSEALVSVLRWSPDCVCWFDYTTTIPTFNCRALANLTSVSKTITAQQERGISLSPKYDRQLAGVIIEYKQSSVENGVAWPQIYYDKADAGGSGLFLGTSSTPIPGSGTGTPTVSDYTPYVAHTLVELTGSTMNWTDIPVVTTPVAALAAGTVSAWQAVDGALNDPLIDATTIVLTNITITDSSGNPVSTSTYPNVLVKGQLSDWMAGVVWEDCTITADAAWTQYADAAHKIPSGVITSRQISHRITLTNATTQTYRVSTYFDIGEQVPWGLALALFNSLKTLQYAGSVSFVGDLVITGIGVGTLLTLVGPSNTYGNCLVQSVRIVPHTGELTARFSPSARLDAPELVELARANRFRTIYNMPTGRSTGMPPGSSDVGLGTATAKENTQHSVAQSQLLAATFGQGTTGGNPNGTTQLVHDAQGEQITAQRLSAAGAVVTADGGGNPIGQIALKLADIPAATASADKVSLGVIHYVDSLTGTTKKCVAAVGPPHSEPTPANCGNGANIYLGGGSGGGGATAIELSLKYVYSDYVVGWANTALAISQLTDVLASCTCATAHGIAVGTAAQVVIAGATPSGYNGSFVAVALSTTVLQYAVPSVLASASGTITCRVGGSGLSVSSLTSASSTVITASCAAPHGLAIGATLNGTIAGASPSGYNGTFANLVPISTTQFTYTVGSTPASTPATGSPTYQADVWVAKPFKLRCSRSAETGCDGTNYTFTYGRAPTGDPTLNDSAITSGNCSRVKAVSGGASETEYVSPEWLQADIFYAVPAATTVQVTQGSNQFNIGMAAIEDTRAWAAIAF